MLLLLFKIASEQEVMLQGFHVFLELGRALLHIAHGFCQVLLKSRIGEQRTGGSQICSVTFMDPSSAPMREPILPAQISAVITGPISRIIDSTTIEGVHDSAPNRVIVGRDCNVITSPIMNAVIPTSGSD